MDSIMNLYLVRDLVAENCICAFLSANDGLAIRENAPALSRVAPLGDLEMLQVGTVDVKNLKITLLADSDFKKVSWDSYKFPESPIASNPAVKPHVSASANKVVPLSK